MTEPLTCAERLLSRAAALGVDYLFANLGSDHPAFIEAFARLTRNGGRLPQIIICPHEMTALSAAHGYAMITRRPQMVLVHVDVGTQNLGGSIHNASRGRVPALVVAGLSPVTENAGRTGGRNEFIHDLQDAPRQDEIVRQYMKWAYQVRAAEMIDGVLLRAIQIAVTEPQGPVYLDGAREVWEAPADGPAEPAAHWPAAVLAGLPAAGVEEIAGALVRAERPLVITSYLGRRPAAVERLVDLSERVGLGVLEVSPTYLNFPGGHPHHLGYRRNSHVADADLILLLDVDVPWLKSQTTPAPAARLFHIDADPVKTGLGFWHYPAERVFQADSLPALEQVLDAVGPAPAGRDRRRQWIESVRPAPESAGADSNGDITAEELTRAVRRLVNERSLVVFEAPTATELIPSGLRLERPGSYFSSGGTGLGWGVNAAIGAKLARPDAEVIALVGDGCFQFAVPSSAYWVAGAYRTPFLTVIYNNGGWNAPKFSTLGVHPQGDAARHDAFWTTMTSGARLADIAAAAGDVAAFHVGERSRLDEVLDEARQEVRRGRPAVVDVRLAPFSRQVLGRR